MRRSLRGTQSNKTQKLAPKKRRQWRDFKNRTRCSFFF